RGRPQAGPRHPALDGARVRQGGAGEAARQLDAQQAGAPARVLPAQGQGVGDVVGVGARAAGAVARRVRAAAGAEGPQQVAGGARRQAEAGGQGGGVGLVLGGPPQGGPDRQRDGGGHGAALGSGG